MDIEKARDLADQIDGLVHQLQSALSDDVQNISTVEQLNTAMLNGGSYNLLPGEYTGNFV